MQSSDIETAMPFTMHLYLVRFVCMLCLTCGVASAQAQQPQTSDEVRGVTLDQIILEELANGNDAMPAAHPSRRSIIITSTARQYPHAVLESI